MRALLYWEGVWNARDMAVSQSAADRSEKFLHENSELVFNIFCPKYFMSLKESGRKCLFDSKYSINPFFRDISFVLKLRFPVSMILEQNSMSERFDAAGLKSRMFFTSLAASSMDIEVLFNKVAADETSFVMVLIILMST